MNARGTRANVEFLNNIFGVLNVAVVGFFIWSIVDFIRGHLHHYESSNSSLLNAMSLVWFALSVITLLNSITLHKIVEVIGKDCRDES